MLTLGLAACNNNDRAGLDEMNDRNDRVGLNVTNRNTDLNDVRNVRNNDGFDHNGPLTEDYRNDNDNDLDLNLFDPKNRDRTNKPMISAYQTTLNSDQYPETKAIVIQDAKYQYVPVGKEDRFDTSFFKGFGPYYGQFSAVMPNVPQQDQQQPNRGTENKVPTQTPEKQKPMQPAPNQKQQAPAQKPAPNQKQQAPAQQTAPKNQAATGNISEFARQVIDLTNVERRKKGLSDLKADTQLSSVAQKKAADMQQNHYFSHTSPTYGSPFDMMRDFGVTYKSAGENIAQGQQTPKEVVTAWMNSEGHRANILSTKYTHIGVGFENAGKHWSQMFIGK